MTNYKAVVTFEDGTHAILRMTKELVAKFVTMFRKMQKNPFGNIYLWPMRDDKYINMNFITKTKFINEYTGEEYLSLA